MTGVPRECPGDTNIPGVAEVGSGTKAGMAESAGLMGPPPPPSKSTPGKLWTLKIPAGMELTRPPALGCWGDLGAGDAAHIPQGAVKSQISLAITLS